MNREEVRHWSPSLDQEMAYRIYGHGGRPVVAFPSQDGRFWDFEGFGMVDACAELIEAGRLRLVAADGIDWQTWTNRDAHPPIALAGTRPTIATSPMSSCRSYASAPAG